MAEYGKVYKVPPPKKFRFMHRSNGAVLTIYGYTFEQALTRLKVNEAEVYWVELLKGPAGPMVIPLTGPWPGLTFAPDVIYEPAEA